jgi:hypothetical protein
VRRQSKARHRKPIQRAAHTLLSAEPEVSMDSQTPIWADDSDDLVPGPLDEEDDEFNDDDDDDDDDEGDEPAADEEADNG